MLCQRNAEYAIRHNIRDEMEAKEGSEQQFDFEVVLQGATAKEWACAADLQRLTRWCVRLS